MLKITGYSDRVSARPGETIKFMVNCELGNYRTDIVKLICGDSSPDGPDFKEKLKIYRKITINIQIKRKRKVPYINPFSSLYKSL